MTEKLLNKHFHLVSPCDLDLRTPKSIQPFYKLLSTNWPKYERDPMKNGREIAERR